MLSKKETFISTDWRRINMRNVSHLLGVEFIHDLYNRHFSRINSIRFRNTVVTWKDGQVNSYAPEGEWNLLSRWFGEMFFRLDPILLKQIKKLFRIDRGLFFHFIKTIKSTNFTKSSNTELAIKLIGLQQFVLGELYKVNLVQIEHALTGALKRILQDCVEDESKHSAMLADLIITDKLTEAQKEEMAFARIVRLGKRKGIEIPKNDKKIINLVNKHYEKFAYVHCAYGELPHDMDFYFKKYSEFYKNFDLPNTNIKKIIKVRKKISDKLLHSLHNYQLNKLVPIMRDVGVFRDKNKALLGCTIKYKLNLLDEIATRGLETRDSLDFYLLKEVVVLLDGGDRLSSEEVARRKKEGVVMVRSEYMDYLSESPAYLKINNFTSESIESVKGACASPGILEGNCKVVLCKEDAVKVKQGDIMVAIGTDFDLMDAIQRSAAVITEEGGLLSHASVVCRELKKPCCISVRNATRLLNDGLRIQLNATAGTIKIIQ